MKFPPDYPYSPPSIRFLTKVWHPNVYEVSRVGRLGSLWRVAKMGTKTLEEAFSTAKQPRGFFVKSGPRDGSDPNLRIYTAYKESHVVVMRTAPGVGNAVEVVDLPERGTQ